MRAHAERLMALPGGPRAASVGAVLMTALGVALFGYTIERAGVAETLTNIQRVGVAGFAGILALSGLRLVVRALAWVLCLEGDRRLTVSRALDATLIGEALGNMTPLGTFVSEPSKALLARGPHVPLGAAASALAVENIFYAFTVNIVIAVGTLAFLLNFPLDPTLRRASVVALACVGVVVVAGLFVLARGATPLTSMIGWTARRWPHHQRLHTLVDRLHALESRIYGFYGRYRHRLLPLLALEATFHLAGIAEVFLTLSLVSSALGVTLLSALILESTGRIINVLFKFIPFRLGVDEAGSGLVSGAMGLGGPVGVTLAVIRKARILCWTGLGVLLLARRGLSVRAIVHDAEATQNLRV